MAQKDARTIHAELAKPFAPEDLEWRLQKADENGRWGIAVPYVTNRAIQARLDEVVGPENWYNEFKPWHGNGKKEAQICGISIYFEERGQFITKWDGAEDSDIEPVKGGLSDSMKRAAVQWGIGRTLYNMDTVFVNVEKLGRSWVIKKDDRDKMDKAYLDMLSKLKLQPAAPIGAQSELTPRQAKEPAGGGDPVPPVRQEKSAQQPEGKPAPAYDCIVRTAVLRPGMTASSTAVSLEYPDNKFVDAFARGEHPELVPGARLSGVKLTRAILKISNNQRKKTNRHNHRRRPGQVQSGLRHSTHRRNGPEVSSKQPSPWTKAFQWDSSPDCTQANTGPVLQRRGADHSPLGYDAS